MSLIRIRSPHILAACILLTLPLASTAVLIAKTSKTIQGTNPELGDVLKAEITAGKFSLLGFKYNNTDYNAANISSLPTFSASLSPSTLLTSITPTVGTLAADKATDINEDINIHLEPKTALTPKLLDVNGVDVSASTDSFCDLLDSNPGPYQIAIAGDLLLKTEFGAPRAQELSATEGVVGHQPQNKYGIAITPTLCYLQPELTSNYGTSDPSVWKQGKGFLPQSNTQPSKNFPTTGFMHSAFDMRVVGFEGLNGVEWESERLMGQNMDAFVTSSSADTVKVQLIGQETLAGIVAAFQGPAIIRITNTVNDVSYSFEINKWFINDRGLPPYERGYEYGDALGVCMSSQANVRLPTVAELTNGAKGTGYTRAIGGGVFAEWGNPTWYNQYYWDSTKFSWTSDADPTAYGSYFNVLGLDGTVYSSDNETLLHATCVNR